MTVNIWALQLPFEITIKTNFFFFLMFFNCTIISDAWILDDQEFTVVLKLTERTISLQVGGL
jgi:hypothetical protein